MNIDKVALKKAKDEMRNKISFIDNHSILDNSSRNSGYGMDSNDAENFKRIAYNITEKLYSSPSK